MSKPSIRGFALVALIFIIVGFSLSASLINEGLDYYHKEAKRQAKKSDESVREAKESLLIYLLLRAESPFGIASGAANSVTPRLLMLPCPDNLGDKLIDGTDDSPCGAPRLYVSNKVRDILNSGSRFGRLPWRIGSQLQDSGKGSQVNNALYNGLGKDFRDTHNNRLWYALSRNMAPDFKDKDNDKDKNIPLNFHHLYAKKDNWLSVVNQNGHTLSTKTAAVILAPGQIKTARVNEETTLSKKYKYPADVTGTNSILAPANYFESYTVNGKNYSNNNKDGIFVHAPPREDFNDALSYIDLDEMMNSDGFFYKSYLRIIGLTNVHNAPLTNRPLRHLHTALSTYRTAFGFYPTPAENTTANINSRQRHCAVYHSGRYILSATVAANTKLLAVVDTAIALTAFLTLTTFSATATVSLTSPTGFLVAEQTPTSSQTLAAYARLTFPAGVFLVNTTLLTTLSGTLQLAAGTEVVLLSSTIATIPPNTPLAPEGHLSGWLSEHDVPYRRAGNNKEEFILPADTRSNFLSGAVLTLNGSTVTLTNNDIFILSSGSTIQLEQNYNKIIPLSGVANIADSMTTIHARPTQATYERRQFAIRLLTDITNASNTVYAPAVLFPWREIITDADSRDNLHPYPPCFDSRNFFDRKFRLFLEDNPVFYAVAESCHYGNGGKNCGKENGLTVQISKDAIVALSSPIALTHSFTFTRPSVLSATIVILSITVTRGIIQNSIAITLTRDTDFTVSADLILRLPKGYIFASGRQIILPQNTRIRGGDNTWLDDVEALLIYSPAPLPRVACTANTPSLMTVASAAVLSSQKVGEHDLTSLCYWLDDPENADADNVYRIHPFVRRGTALHNDYVLFFGGKLRG